MYAGQAVTDESAQSPALLLHRHSSRAAEQQCPQRLGGGTRAEPAQASPPALPTCPSSSDSRLGATLRPRSVRSTLQGIHRGATHRHTGIHQHVVCSCRPADHPPCTERWRRRGAAQSTCQLEASRWHSLCALHLEHLPRHHQALRESVRRLLDKSIRQLAQPAAGAARGRGARGQAGPGDGWG